MYYITETVNGTVVSLVGSQDWYESHGPIGYMDEMINTSGSDSPKEPTAYYEFYLDSKGGQHVEFEIHHLSEAGDEHLEKMKERYK